MADAILVLNAGSSSIKFALFEAAGRRLAQGKIEGIGTAPHFRARDVHDGAVAEKRWEGGGHEDLLGHLLSWAEGRLGGERLVAAGHRIVHGGAHFIAPQRLTEATVAALEALSPLAPLHQPHNLNAVMAVARLRPGLPQIGCFDTAFHAAMPPVARRLALPRALEREGVRRYGFHGLSYEYIAGRLREIAPQRAGGRIIAAHLGNGASLCALRAGQSIDTTMGFSTLDGLMMGTRCGALDPGVPLYLMRQHGLDAAALEELFYRRSGLLGVSGISSDMRALLASSDPAAREAVELFAFRIARETGALAMSLGGLDGLVFTAGIGENAAEIRSLVVERIAWLGVTLDEAANARSEILISGADSAVSVWVIPADEETMILRHTIAALA